MNKNEQMPANEWGKLRSFLGDEMDQEDINIAIGTGANGRTRSEIADQLREWLRTRPKAI
jgi:hypothetical protein